MNTKSKSKPAENLEVANPSPASRNVTTAGIVSDQGIINIGKQVFAIELHWELSSSLAKAKQEAKKTSK